MSVINKFLRKRSVNANAEMAFVDHLEALRWHVIRSLIAIIISAILVFINVEWVFDKIILAPSRPDFIAYKWFCQLSHLMNTDVLCMKELKLEFQNTALSGQFMMSFSVSFILGFIVAFPYIFYEFWKFVKPALTEQEYKNASGIVFWVSLLFLLGILFAYYIVVPFTINFFANYQLSPQFKNIITMANYYDTLADLIIGLGIVFELPVLIYFLSKIGLVTPKFLKNNRGYAMVIIMVLAAVITPPDMFSIWLVALPLMVLFELGIFISSRVHKETSKEIARSTKYDNL